MATATRFGFEARCIRCGCGDMVSVNLTDLASYSCGSCSEEFTRDDVLAFLAGWRRVLAWCDLAETVD